MSIEERMKMISEDLELFETTTLDNIKFLLDENWRLREERDSFQRVGIKVQEENVRLVEALEEILNHTSGEPYQDNSEYMYRLLEVRMIVQTTLQAYKLLENDL